jgi:hypothetical protein
MSLYYKVDQSIYNKLCGLAFRIADNKYMIERYGVKGSAVERAQNHKTIIMLFNELDAARVPFWVQNSAISFGDDWRRYKSECLYNWLRARGVDVSGVSCL